MSWGYVAVAAGTVISGYMSSQSSKDAAKAAGKGADAASAESARQFDVTNANLAPWRTTGAGALNQLARLFGLPSTTPEAFQSQQDQLVGDTMLPAGVYTKYVGKTGKDNNLITGNIGNGSPAHRLLHKDRKRGDWYEVWYGDKRIGTLRPGGKNGRFINDTGTDINALRQQNNQQNGPQTPSGPDMSAFFTSPGYQFRRDEGMRGINNSFAARGGALSGNALRALTDFNSNIASSEFGNYVNQLAGIAGVGQSATNTTATFGAQNAQNIGNNAIIAGNARASGILGSNQAWGDTINGLAGLYGYYKQPRQVGYSGAQADPYGNYGGGGMRLA